MKTATEISEYLTLLPAQFQSEGNEFLNEFLKGFEELLSKRYGDLSSGKIQNFQYGGFASFSFGNLNSVFENFISQIDDKVLLHLYRDRYQNSKRFLRSYFYSQSSFDQLSTFLSQNFSPALDALLPDKTVTKVIDELPRFVETTFLRDFLPAEKLIEHIPNYFDPNYTPAQFLEWLASWLSLKLKRGEDYHHELDLHELDDFCGQVPPLLQKVQKQTNSTTGESNYNIVYDEARESYNRSLVGNVFNLNQKRGTKEGLKEYLEFYIQNSSYFADIAPGRREKISLAGIVDFEIHEYLYPHVIVDVESADDPRYREAVVVGESSVVHEREPFFFRVHVNIAHNNIELIRKIKTDITQLIEEEKPGHTWYALTFEIQDMKIATSPEDPAILTHYNSTLGGTRQEV